MYIAKPIMHFYKAPTPPTPPKPTCKKRRVNSEIE